MFPNKRTHTKERTFLAIGLLTLFILLVVAGCTPGLNAAGEPAVVPDDAVQLPDQAQAYIEQSQAALAERLQISPDEIELDSITEPAASDGAYIVKLMAEGQIYEYHGRNGEVLLVAEPLPPGPSSEGRITFEQAPVDSLTVKIDKSAAAPVSVLVRGHLPDNCTKIHEGLVNRVDETTFAISLTTRRPASEACGEVLVPYETNVSLGVEVKDLPAGEYAVIVNDQITETFSLEPDSSDSEGPLGLEGVTELPTVSIDLDEAVATSVNVHQRPAVTATAEMPHWARYPEHIEVEIENYAHTNTLHPARLYVYPVADYTQASDIAADQTSTLSELLIKKANLAEEKTLPFLPVLNAQSLMYTRAQYLDFDKGSGIRYLTQFGQAAGPINNQELLYTFQGLTADGAYYVAAIFPIAQAGLPADLASADASFPDGFDAYIAGVKATLETAATDSFTPNLEVLDEIVASIEVVK